MLHSNKASGDVHSWDHASAVLYQICCRNRDLNNTTQYLKQQRACLKLQWFAGPGATANGEVGGGRKRMVDEFEQVSASIEGMQHASSKHV